MSTRTPEQRAVQRLRVRLEQAETGAAKEAGAHPDRERAIYCDGTAHGLREALRMLDEETRR